MKILIAVVAFFVYLFLFTIISVLIIPKNSPGILFAIVNVLIIWFSYNIAKRAYKLNTLSLIKILRNKISKKATFKIEDIPDGYRIYNKKDIFVRGVHRRRKNVLNWAKGDNLSIYAKPEPNNKYDENAIAIYGKSSTGEYHIGYVRADTAEDLAEDELTNKVKVRLIEVRIQDSDGSDGFDMNIFIQYDILIPKKG